MDDRMAQVSSNASDHDNATSSGDMTQSTSKSEAGPTKGSGEKGPTTMVASPTDSNPGQHSSTKDANVREENPNPVASSNQMLAQESSRGVVVSVDPDQNSPSNDDLSLGGERDLEGGPLVDDDDDDPMDENLGSTAEDHEQQTAVDDPPDLEENSTTTSGLVQTSAGFNESTISDGVAGNLNLNQRDQLSRRAHLLGGGVGPISGELRKLLNQQATKLFPRHQLKLLHQQQRRRRRRRRQQQQKLSLLNQKRKQQLLLDQQLQYPPSLASNALIRTTQTRQGLAAVGLAGQQHRQLLLNQQHQQLTSGDIGLAPASPSPANQHRLLPASPSSGSSPSSTLAGLSSPGSYITSAVQRLFQNSKLPKLAGGQTKGSPSSAYNHENTDQQTVELEPTANQLAFPFGDYSATSAGDTDNQAGHHGQQQQSAFANHEGHLSSASSLPSASSQRLAELLADGAGPHPDQWSASGSSESPTATVLPAKQLIPIEIIGLDPLVASSILNGKAQTSAAGDTWAPADAHRDPSSAGGQQQANPVAAATDQSPGGDTGLAARPKPSSVFHIHHFHHTQGPSIAATESAAGQPNEQTNDEPPATGAGSQQPDSQQQQVAINEKGELLYGQVIEQQQQSGEQLASSGNASLTRGEPTDTGSPNEQTKQQQQQQQHHHQPPQTQAASDSSSSSLADELPRQQQQHHHHQHHQLSNDDPEVKTNQGHVVSSVPAVRFEANNNINPAGTRTQLVPYYAAGPGAGQVSNHPGATSQMVRPVNGSRLAGSTNRIYPTSNQASGQTTGWFQPADDKSQAGLESASQSEQPAGESAASPDGKQQMLMVAYRAAGRQLNGPQFQQQLSLESVATNQTGGPDATENGSGPQSHLDLVVPGAAKSPFNEGSESSSRPQQVLEPAARLPQHDFADSNYLLKQAAAATGAGAGAQQLAGPSVVQPVRQPISMYVNPLVMLASANGVHETISGAGGLAKQQQQQQQLSLTNGLLKSQTIPLISMNSSKIDQSYWPQNLGIQPDDQEEDRRILAQLNGFDGSQMGALSGLNNANKYPSTRNQQLRTASSASQVDNLVRQHLSRQHQLASQTADNRHLFRASISPRPMGPTREAGATNWQAHQLFTGQPSIFSQTQLAGSPASRAGRPTTGLANAQLVSLISQQLKLANSSSSSLAPGVQQQLSAALAELAAANGTSIGQQANGRFELTLASDQAPSSRLLLARNHTLSGPTFQTPASLSAITNQQLLHHRLPLLHSVPQSTQAPGSGLQTTPERTTKETSATGAGAQQLADSGLRTTINHQVLSAPPATAGAPTTTLTDESNVHSAVPILDSTGNIALAFIFTVSLLTLILIAASLIYRRRRNFGAGGGGGGGQAGPGARPMAEAEANNRPRPVRQVFGGCPQLFNTSDDHQQSNKFGASNMKDCHHRNANLTLPSTKYSQTGASNNNDINSKQPFKWEVNVSTTVGRDDRREGAQKLSENSSQEQVKSIMSSFTNVARELDHTGGHGESDSAPGKCDESGEELQPASESPGIKTLNTRLNQKQGCLKSLLSPLCNNNPPPKKSVSQQQQQLSSDNRNPTMVMIPRQVSGPGNRHDHEHQDRLRLRQISRTSSPSTTPATTTTTILYNGSNLSEISGQKYGSSGAIKAPINFPLINANDSKQVPPAEQSVSINQHPIGRLQSKLEPADATGTSGPGKGAQSFVERTAIKMGYGLHKPSSAGKTPTSSSTPLMSDNYSTSQSRLGVGGQKRLPTIHSVGRATVSSNNNAAATNDRGLKFEPRLEEKKFAPTVQDLNSSRGKQQSNYYTSNRFRKAILAATPPAPPPPPPSAASTVSSSLSSRLPIVPKQQLSNGALRENHLTNLVDRSRPPDPTKETRKRP